jgi:KaiC/GvpD/RAD55 family RecA-like ATPase
VQGPPGTGKTSLGKRMIVSLLQAGTALGIPAHSHSVGSKLLYAVVQHAVRIGLAVRAGQSCEHDCAVSHNSVAQ